MTENLNVESQEVAQSVVVEAAPAAQVVEGDQVVAVELAKKLKILLIQAGINQVDLVKKYNLDKGDLSKVITGKRKTSRIRKIVAQELGMTVDEVFSV